MGIRTINTIHLELFKVLTLVTILFRLCPGLLSTLKADDLLNEVPCPPPFLPNKTLIVKQLAKELNFTEDEINVIVARCRLDKNNSTILLPRVSSLASLCKASTCYTSSPDSYNKDANNNTKTNIINTEDMGQLCINSSTAIVVVFVCIIVGVFLGFLIRHFFGDRIFGRLSQIRQRVFKKVKRTPTNDSRIEENHDMLQDASKEMDQMFKPKYLYVID